MDDLRRLELSLDGPVFGPSSRERPRSAIIFCHGYGANGADLISMAPALAERLPDTIFIAPNAPQPCPVAPGGYQWFPLVTLSRKERDEGTYKTGPLLDGFLSEVLNHFGLEEGAAALFGFSQGTMLSLYVGLRREKALAGIVGFSGALAGSHDLRAEIRSRPPVFLVHGDQDELIPHSAMAEATSALQAAGVEVQNLLETGVGHGIGPRGFQAAAQFLRQILKR